MSENLFLIYFLIAFIAILMICIVIQHRTIKIIRTKLSNAIQNEGHMVTYLDRFSRQVKKNDNDDEWMNETANYISEFIDAEAVGIFLSKISYSNQDGSIKDIDELRVDGLTTYSIVGMNSRFPLALTKDLICDWNNPEQIEALKQEKDSLLKLAFASMLNNNVLLLNDDASSEDGHLLRDIRITSCICIPFRKTGSNAIGMILAINTDRSKKQNFTQEQVARLQSFTSPVLMANNVLRMYGQFRIQWKLREELEFTRKLQLSMLPTSFPTWGTFSINAKSQPSRRVGGDFYDFIELDNNRALVVIGDACGKGLPACLIMTMTRCFIRAGASHFTNLKDLLFEVNHNLNRDTGGDGRYVTLAICLLHKRENTVEYVCAGHTNLIFYVRNHTRVVHPEGAVIGLLPNEFINFDPFTIQFDEDMAFFMYTDGINEAVSLTGEQFGDSRIEASFVESMRKKEDTGKGTQRRAMSPSDIIEKLMQDVDVFTASTDPDTQDDRTLVMISHVSQERKEKI